MKKFRAFATLDGLRGVAAIPVVYLHCSEMFASYDVVQHGYLAVDFFFMLSGFVITHAYGRRLDEGWRSGGFLKTRVLRLYPLYFLGIMLGCARILSVTRFGKVHFAHLWIAETLAWGLLFLPDFINPGTAPSASILYPLDFPAWSLFYELLANVGHTLFLRRRGLRFLGISTGFFAAGLLFVALRHRSLDLGSTRGDLLPASLRMLFAYTLGVLIYKLHRAGRLRFSFHPLISAVVLGVLVIGPPRAMVNGLYDWAVVVLCFPVLLIAGANWEPGTSLGRSACHWIGAASYPVYILHAPLAGIYELAWKRLTHHTVEGSAPWDGLIFLVLVVAVSLLAGEIYDPEMRRLIGKNRREPLPTPERPLETLPS